MCVVRALEIGELGLNEFGGRPQRYAERGLNAKAAQRERGFGRFGDLLEDCHRFHLPDCISAVSDHGEGNIGLVSDQSKGGDDRYRGMHAGVLVNLRREEDDVVVLAVDDAVAKLSLCGQVVDVP